MRVEASVLRAYWVAVITLAVAGLGFYGLIRQFNVYLSKERVELRRPLDAVPTQIGRWQRVGPDTSYPDIMLEELGTRSYLDRVYAIDGDPKTALHVHVAYYTGTIDAVPHIPERCWNANGMVMRGQPEVRDRDRGWVRGPRLRSHFAIRGLMPVS